MSKKRKDNKGRVLYNGEGQDKDGRYYYTYTYNGKRHYIRSWKLTETDNLPRGKRECVSLREQIKEIKQNLFSGINTSKKLTVFELCEKYVSLKKNVRPNTLVGYRTVLNRLKEDSFGGRLIKDVKLSDAQHWFAQLQDSGVSYSTIHSIRTVVKPAFQMALIDGYIRYNPFDFTLPSVIKNDSKKREGLIGREEELFLEFVKNDNHYNRYYEGIYILFKTGLRISEFCGLTMSDIDLHNKTINIYKQLHIRRDVKYKDSLYISETKTDAGKRLLPIGDDVCECFKKILSKPRPKVEPMIDGYVGFLYIDRNGNPMHSLHWDHYFGFIMNKYNKAGNPPIVKVTPHVCRHTYITNMARAGVQPKILQYLAGHSDISITMDVYTHLKYDDAKKELDRIFCNNFATNQEQDIPIYNNL